MIHEEEMDPAEARVRGFRDEVSATAEWLESADTVMIVAILDRLRRACAAVEDDDLGTEATMIRSQFEAMFGRLDGLVAEYPGPVATSSLGLPGDARFLRDMADFLTRRYGLEDEDA